MVKFGTTPWWPEQIDRNAVCLSFDVEWAAADVIADVCALLDERNIKGTFFVTHDGVTVPGHERGLHPNFRRNGDIYRALPDAAQRTDAEVYRHVVSTALSFAPEAKGVRAHSLLFDSSLLPIYRELGIQYDSTLRLELAAGLQPIWKQHGILEIPTYYADYFDLVTGATGFELAGLRLDQPGLKVLDFHPNLIYLNADSVGFYETSRDFYHDQQRLRGARRAGRGTRTLFIDTLDAIARGRFAWTTLDAINDAWHAEAVV